MPRNYISPCTISSPSLFIMLQKRLENHASFMIDWGQLLVRTSTQLIRETTVNKVFLAVIFTQQLGYMGHAIHRTSAF